MPSKAVPVGATRIAALSLALASMGCIPVASPDCGEPVSAPVRVHGFYGESPGDHFHDEVEAMLVAGRGSEPGKGLVPADWALPVPLPISRCHSTEHRHFYRDVVMPDGKDLDRECGLEPPTLAVYSGHGDEEGWSTPDPSLAAFPFDVQLRDVRAGDGPLRYLWLQSCDVMAHGPPDPDHPGDHRTPHKSDPTAAADSVQERNAFARWKPSIADGLRMACSGASELGYKPAPEELWEAFLVRELSVADAFLLTLARDDDVPACLAQGAQGPDASALADRTLVTAAPCEERGWLHLEYPVHCEAAVVSTGPKREIRVSCGDALPGPSTTAGASFPPALPEINTFALPAPQPGHLGIGSWSVSAPFGAVASATNPLWRYFEDSGAVILRRTDDAFTALPCGAVHQWPAIDLDDALAKLGLTPSDLGIDLAKQAPTAIETRTESTPSTGNPRSCAVRSLFLSFPKAVESSATLASYPVFGSSPQLEIQRRGLSPRLAIVSLSAPRRTYRPSGNLILLQPKNVAVTRAHTELALDAANYPPAMARVTLGYEEASERCRQFFLRPTYEIRFPPAGAGPTVLVRVDARAQQAPWRQCATRHGIE